MTKAELQMENIRLKDQFQKFKMSVEDAIEKAIEETCDDGNDHIANFCSRIGIEPPTKRVQLLVEIPFNSSEYTEGIDGIKEYLVVKDNDENTLEILEAEFVV